MARRKKPDTKVDFAEKARLKKLRSAERRAERKKLREAGELPARRTRKQDKPDYASSMVKDDYLWIRVDRSRAYASSILNQDRKRPYWLSFRWEGTKESGPLPVSHFVPCTIFRHEGRAYYGFLFREHRDLFFAELEDVRKEQTDKVRKIAPHLL